MGRRDSLRAHARRRIRRPLFLGQRLAAPEPHRGPRRRRAGRPARRDRALGEAAPGASGRQSAGLLPVQAMTRRLEGKVAIISGAGSVGPGWGNGRATAVRFAEEGANIFAVDRDAERLRETVEGVKKAGGAVATHLCDVTRAKDVAGMVEACLKSYGRIDVLVNNVGGSAAGGPVEMSVGTLEIQIDFSITGMTYWHPRKTLVRLKSICISQVSTDISTGPPAAE